MLCTVPQAPPTHDEIIARVSSYSLNSKKSNIKKTSSPSLIDIDNSMDIDHNDYDYNNNNSRKSIETKLDLDKLAEPIEVLDRAQLKVGDYVDAYCDKTHKWHEAKVLSIKDKSNSNTKIVRIHFQGWNSKHDESIDLDSDRLAHVGTGMKILYDSAVKVSQMIPWFDTNKINEMITNEYGSWHGLGKGNEDTIAIKFEVSDYCIDYTYSNPTLWLISSSGVWYRIAGPLAPGGYHGHTRPAYRSYFDLMIEKFVTSAHVVMVLLDYMNLPGNSKLSLQAVSEEINLRSSNTISLNDILKNYSFIYEQISELEQPADWQRAVNFKTCYFAKQLVTQGLIYVDKENKKAGLPSIRKKKEEIALVTMTTTEDDDLIGKVKSAPPPSYKGYKLRVPITLHSHMVFVWTTLTNFSSFLGIPLIGLEFLEDILTGSIISTINNDINDNLNNDDDEDERTITINDNIILREIHTSLITKILIDRIKNRSPIKYKIFNDVDIDYDEEKAYFNNSTTLPSIVGLFSKKVEMAADMMENKVSSFVRVGHSWIEVIRLLISEKFGLLINTNHDPIGECKNIIDILVKEMENASMYNTADASGLDEFTDALEAIAKKIDSGHYEAIDITPNTTKSSTSDNSNDDNKLKIGKVMDVYRKDLGIWFAATIIGIESRPTTITASVTDADADADVQNIIETYVKVRYNGWGADAKHDEVINVLSDYIKPAGTIIDDPKLRYQPPDSSSDTAESKMDTDTKTWPCPFCGKIYNSNPGLRYHVEENKCRNVEEEKASISKNDRLLGHAGIYEDIKIVLNNYAKSTFVEFNYYFHHNDILKLLEKLYENKVLKPILEKNNPSTNNNNNSDDAKVYESVFYSLGDATTTTSYSNISLENKVLVLKFLCEEFTDTEKTRKFMDNIDSYQRKKRKELNKLKLMEKKDAIDNDDDDDNDDNDIEEVKASKVITRKRGRDSTTTNYEDDDIAETTTTDNTFDASKIPDIDLIRIALKPIGKDRDNNNYYIIPLDFKYRIFVQTNPDNMGSEWLIYSTVNDIYRLYNHFIDRVTSEKNLKKKMIEHFRKCNINLKEGNVHGKLPIHDENEVRFFQTDRDAVINKHFDRYKRLFEDVGDFGIIRPILIDLEQYKTLGVGVSAQDNKVTIANFRVPEGAVSGGKENGARIHDQVILCSNNTKTDNNSRLVFSIADIQEAVKSVHDAANNNKQTRSKDKNMRLLLLRLKDELHDSRMKPDEEKSKAIETQTADDNKIIRNLASWAMYGSADMKKYLINDMDPFLEPINSLYRLISKVISMILKTRHPIILNDQSMESTKQFIITIHDKIMLQQKADKNFKKQFNIPIVYGPLTLELISTLVNILIEFEDMLFTSGLAFSITWNIQRKRLKWKQYMESAKSFTEVSLGVGVLYESIQWANILQACNPIPIDTYLANLGDDVIKLRNIDLPAISSHVYYFSDGHIQALEKDNEDTNKIPDASINNKLWGGITPTPGKSLLCSVAGVKVFTIKTSKSENVFAHVDLVQKTLSQALKEVAMPQTNFLFNAKMNRIIRRIINLLSLYPNSEPFARPVDTGLLPDYPSIVKDPMDLSTMINKSNNSTYTSITEFINDIDLIKKNCVLYCNERFPDIVNQVHVFHSEAMKLLDVFKLDLDSSSFSDNNDTITTNNNTSDSSRYPKTFSVALRITRDSMKFIVRKDLVTRAVTQVYHYYDVIKYINNNNDDDDGDEGYISGSRSNLIAGDNISWNWLKIDWYDGDNDTDNNTKIGQYVNPWDIKLVVNK